MIVPCSRICRMRPSVAARPLRTQPSDPMNRLLSLSLLAVLLTPILPAAQPAGGTTDGLYLTNEQPPVQVSTSALFQYFEEGDTTLTQLTMPLAVFVAPHPRLGLSMRVAATSIEGDQLTSVFGPADAQAALSYLLPLGAASAVASVAANLPFGEAALSRSERSTAFLLGQNFYDFRLPSVAQGFNVAPGLTVAVPLNARVAVGAGVVYQVRGSFEPLRFDESEYDPGDELLVTAGLDVRLGEEGSVALDGSYIYYTEDTFGDLAYTTGDAVAVTAQWSGPVGAHRARLLGRVRHKAESEIPPEVGAFLGLDATVPTQGRVLGEVRFDLSPRLALGTFVQGRHYTESEAFSAKTLVDAGLAPEYLVGRGLTITGRLGATAGSFWGAHGGVGARWSL